MADPVQPVQPRQMVYDVNEQQRLMQDAIARQNAAEANKLRMQSQNERAKALRQSNLAGRGQLDFGQQSVGGGIADLLRGHQADRMQRRAADQMQGSVGDLNAVAQQQGLTQMKAQEQARQDTNQHRADTANAAVLAATTANKRTVGLQKFKAKQAKEAAQKKAKVAANKRSPLKVMLDGDPQTAVTASVAPDGTFYDRTGKEMDGNWTAYEKPTAGNTTSDTVVYDSTGAHNGGKPFRATEKGGSLYNADTGERLEGQSSFLNAPTSSKSTTTSTNLGVGQQKRFEEYKKLVFQTQDIKNFVGTLNDADKAYFDNPETTLASIFTDSLPQSIGQLAKNEFRNIPAPVKQLYTKLARMDSEVRHALFGSAVTIGEQHTAQEFMAAIKGLPLSDVLMRINEGQAGGLRGMDTIGPQGTEWAIGQGFRPTGYTPLTGDHYAPEPSSSPPPSTTGAGDKYL